MFWQRSVPPFCNKNVKNRKNNLKKAFFSAHLVRPSFSPIVCAFCLLLAVLYAVAIFHPGALSWLRCPKFNFFLFMIIFLMSLGVWLYSVVIEATFEGNHSFMVQRGIRLGFILFVISEIMFFFSFFWAFFHSSLSPNVEVGCIWPPSGVTRLTLLGCL